MEQNDALLILPKNVIKLSVVLVICKFINIMFDWQLRLFFAEYVEVCWSGDQISSFKKTLSRTKNWKLRKILSIINTLASIWFRHGFSVWKFSQNKYR